MFACVNQCINFAGRLILLDPYNLAKIGGGILHMLVFIVRKRDLNDITNIILEVSLQMGDEIIINVNLRACEWM